MGAAQCCVYMLPSSCFCNTTCPRGPFIHAIQNMKVELCCCKCRNGFCYNHRLNTVHGGSTFSAVEIFRCFLAFFKHCGSSARTKKIILSINCTIYLYSKETKYLHMQANSVLQTLTVIFLPADVQMWQAKCEASFSPRADLWHSNVLKAEWGKPEEASSAEEHRLWSDSSGRAPAIKPKKQQSGRARGGRAAPVVSRSTSRKI